MRFEHDGMALWYGTPDAPAPHESIPATVPSGQAIVTITVGVRPPSASNSATVRYRVNDGPEQTVTAGFLRHDVQQKAQYFAARLPALQAGDKVDYIAICRSPGGQVPIPQQAGKLVSSFRVVPASSV